MPKKPESEPRSKPEARTPEPAVTDAGARLNKARVAFETYKKRVAAPTGPEAYAPGKPAGHAVPPFGHPSPLGTPSGAFVPPHVLPAWPAPPVAGPQPADSLIESLGTLVHLSIQAINAGLAGGIALMQGFPGSEAGHGCDCHDACDCQCEDDCCRPHHGCECCGGCHPSVHGC
jgi:hypothetical protein